MSSNTQLPLSRQDWSCPIVGRTCDLRLSRSTCLTRYAPSSHDRYHHERSCCIYRKHDLETLRKPSIVSCRAIAQLPPDLREHPLVLLIISAYDPAFVQSVTGVRNALDKRLHNAIFGDALHAERVLKQFSYIRTGKLANINLLHLIDKDGAFKYDDPLASFATFSAKDAGIHFRDAFERLSQCINIATPSLGPAAQRFLPALKTVVVEHIDLGVDWKQISSCLLYTSPSPRD